MLLGDRPRTWLPSPEFQTGEGAARWVTRGTGAALLASVVAASVGVGACEPLDDRRPRVDTPQVGLDPTGPGDAGSEPGGADASDAQTGPLEVLPNCDAGDLCECPDGTSLCGGRCISTTAGSCCSSSECGAFQECNTSTNRCGCQPGAVSCDGACLAPGSCCVDADCGGAGVGTCGAGGVCACTAGAFGPSCAGRFLGLGVADGLDADSEATALSGDGTVVVGWSGFAGDPPLASAARWVWQSNQVLDLGTSADDVSGPTSIATAVSHDGSVVVGDASSQLFGSDTFVAFRWTSETGLDVLDPGSASTFTRAEAVSSDGSIVFGYADNDGGPNAGARWRSAAGNALELISADPESFRIGAVSGDASVIAGSLLLETPVLFDAALTGAARFRPLDRGAFASGTINGVSGNGAQIVGTMDGAQAVRWVNSNPAGAPSVGNLQELGAGDALDVSDAGVVVGNSGGVAVVWDAAGTQRTLLSILEEANAGGLQGWTLTSANGISDDGLVIAGAGARGGRREAWVLRLAQAL
jgi:hypothetical protein